MHLHVFLEIIFFAQCPARQFPGDIGYGLFWDYRPCAAGFFSLVVANVFQFRHALARRFPWNDGMGGTQDEKDDGNDGKEHKTTAKIRPKPTCNAPCNV